MWISLHHFAAASIQRSKTDVEILLTHVKAFFFFAHYFCKSLFEVADTSTFTLLFGLIQNLNLHKLDAISKIKK